MLTIAFTLFVLSNIANPSLENPTMKTFNLSIRDDYASYRAKYPDIVRSLHPDTRGLEEDERANESFEENLALLKKVAANAHAFRQRQLHLFVLGDLHSELFYYFRDFFRIIAKQLCICFFVLERVFRQIHSRWRRVLMLGLLAMFLFSTLYIFFEKHYFVENQKNSFRFILSLASQYEFLAYSSVNELCNLLIILQCLLAPLCFLLLGQKPKPSLKTHHADVIKLIKAAEDSKLKDERESLYRKIMSSVDEALPKQGAFARFVQKGLSYAMTGLLIWSILKGN